MEGRGLACPACLLAIGQVKVYQPRTAFSHGRQPGSAYTEAPGEVEPSEAGAVHGKGAWFDLRIHE